MMGSDCRGGGAETSSHYLANAGENTSSRLQDLCISLKGTQRLRREEINNLHRSSLYDLIKAQEARDFFLVLPVLQKTSGNKQRNLRVLASTIPMMLGLSTLLSPLLNHMYLMPSVYVLSLFTLALVSGLIVSALNFSYAGSRDGDLGNFIVAANIAMSLSLATSLLTLFAAIGIQANGPNPTSIFALTINQFPLILIFSLLVGISLLCSLIIEISRLWSVPRANTLSQIEVEKGKLEEINRSKAEEIRLIYNSEIRGRYTPETRMRFLSPLAKELLEKLWVGAQAGDQRKNEGFDILKDIFSKLTEVECAIHKKIEDNKKLWKTSSPNESLQSKACQIINSREEFIIKTAEAIAQILEGYGDLREPEMSGERGRVIGRITAAIDRVAKEVKIEVTKIGNPKTVIQQGPELNSLQEPRAASAPPSYELASS